MPISESTRACSARALRPSVCRRYSNGSGWGADIRSEVRALRWVAVGIGENDHDVLQLREIDVLFAPNLAEEATCRKTRWRLAVRLSHAVSWCSANMCSQALPAGEPDEKRGEYRPMRRCSWSGLFELTAPRNVAKLALLRCRKQNSFLSKQAIFAS